MFICVTVTNSHALTDPMHVYNMYNVCLFVLFFHEVKLQLNVVNNQRFPVVGVVLTGCICAQDYFVLPLGAVLYAALLF